MKTNRRNFIKSSSILLAAVLYPGKDIFSAVKLIDPAGIRNISSNIGIYTEKGGTIGWYANDDAVIVIDAQFPDSAEHFYDELKTKTSKKIDILFNTHHHGDHTAGNYYLGKFANKIVAQENCPKLQRKFYGTGERAAQQVYAGTTFRDNWEVDLGKEKIKAYHFGPAHTLGDAIYHFQNANVVHMGDVVFNRTYPYMDRPAGATAKGAITYLEKSIKLFDKDSKFIYGHASKDELVTGSIDDLKLMRDYFSALLDFVGGEIKKGKSPDEILKAESVPGFENLTERWEGAKNMNLKAAYEELNNS